MTGPCINILWGSVNKIATSGLLVSLSFSLSFSRFYSLILEESENKWGGAEGEKDFPLSRGHNAGLGSWDPEKCLN